MGRRRRRCPRRGSSAPPSSRPSVRQTAKSAHLPGSSEPMSSRRSTAAPPRVPSRIASRAVIAVPPPRPRATSSACFTSRNRSPRSFDAVPSTPRPTAIPASSMSRTGATPAPSRRFEVGQWATPVPVEANCAMSASERWTQWAHQTSSAEPAEPVEVLDRAAAVELDAVGLLLDASRRGGCGAAARAGGRARPTPPSARRVTENGEHGATASWTQRPAGSCRAPRGAPSRRARRRAPRRARRAAGRRRTRRDPSSRARRRSARRSRAPPAPRPRSGPSRPCGKT